MTAERPEAAGRAPAAKRCGFIALAGAPNAGKSTLLNRLVGSKVSIVTPKVQTTRSRIIGIVIAGEAQLVFVDTPGIFAPKRRLERAMVAAAWVGLADADIVVLLVDTALCLRKLKGAIDGDSLAIIKGLEKHRREAILVLNKIDLVKRPALLELAAALNAVGNFSDTFMISAFTGDGVADMRAHLATIVPEGPWLYGEDQLSDISLRLLAAEIWQERDDGAVRIEQTFYVRRDTQKAMVLGKGGARIKSIGSAARAELERLFERRVHLFIHVKVRRDWINKPEHYRAMGLDFKA